MKNAWSKMRAYLIRLSLIMAVCRVAETKPGDIEEITPIDGENAATLVEYFNGMARKSHGPYTCGLKHTIHTSPAHEMPANR